MSYIFVLQNQYWACRKKKKKSLRNLKKENHEVKGNVKYSQTNI